MSLGCPNCGLELIADARFCRRCGVAIGTAKGVEDIIETRPLYSSGDPNAYQNVSLGNAPVYQPGYGYPAGPKASGLEMPRRKKRWIVLAVAVFLSVSVAGLVKNTVVRRVGSGQGPVIAVFSDAYAGITFDDDGAQDLGVPGAFIDSVVSELVPAARAGLIGGDLIVEIDGQKVADRDEAVKALHSRAPGAEVEVKFLRDGQFLTTKLRLGRRGAPEFRLAGRQEGLLGINGGRRVKVPGQAIYGVRLDVRQNDPAYLAGLNTGDVVVRFNGQPVRTYSELTRLIHNATPRTPVDVVYFRDGIQHAASVTMGTR